MKTIFPLFSKSHSKLLLILGNVAMFKNNAGYGLMKAKIISTISTNGHESAWNKSIGMMLLPFLHQNGRTCRW